MLKDILKVVDPEKEGAEAKFSQCRVYLLITMIITILTIASTFMVSDISADKLDIITNMLLYMILIFAGYSVTGKTISSKIFK